jgi:hypothetical protein
MGRRVALLMIRLPATSAGSLSRRKISVLLPTVPAIVPAIIVVVVIVVIVTVVTVIIAVGTVRIAALAIAALSIDGDDCTLVTQAASRSCAEVTEHTDWAVLLVSATDARLIDFPYPFVLDADEEARARAVHSEVEALRHRAGDECGVLASKFVTYALRDLEGTPKPRLRLRRCRDPW